MPVPATDFRPILMGLFSENRLAGHSGKAKNCPHQMSNSTALIIRADAAPRMGTGHVMRGLALAQAARKEGLDVRMVCRLGVSWLRERLAREDIPLLELPDMPPETEEPANLLDQLQEKGFPQPGMTDTPIWVALDGYHFDAACQKAVMAAGYRLLVIDDYAHLPEYHCDILLNQNIGAEQLTYHGSIGRKLLGLDYVLLRQEFWDAREKAQQRMRPTQPQNILVTLGGGNFIEHLEKIAIEMRQPELAGRTIRVIQGGMDADRIRAAFARCPAQLEILPRVDDMSSLLLDTDLCITAGGSTCWELCCLGVSFLTVEVAENQHAIVTLLRKKRIALSYTRETAQTALAGVATYPSFSIGQKINILTFLLKIRLRHVVYDDLDFLFMLANDQDVRKYSFNTQPITFEEHLTWFDNIINSNTAFFLAEVDKEPFASIRFQKKNNETQISISLTRDTRGLGYGAYLIKQAVKKYFGNHCKEEIVAYIKKENISSLKSFQRASFHTDKEVAVGETPAIRLVLPNR